MCGALALASIAQAQTTGVIVGRILDPSGAGIPEAAVVAINQGTQYERTVTADANGDYVMPAMPIGTYTVSASHASFTKLERSGVVLTVNANVRVDLTLALTSTTQAVEVTSTVTEVDTREASLSQLMDQKRMIDLPLNGRNPAALISLVPGASSVSVPTRPSISGVVVRMNGTNGTAQQYLLDGAPFNALQRSDGLPLPPPDVVQEFRVQTSDYSAEFGRNSGGVVSTVTKSGTNELHGSAWEYLRNDALDARGFFDPNTPPLRQNQFGFTLGGPIVIPRIYNGHNKTFFFGSYQGTRIREAVLANSALPPTQAERAGDFSRDAVKPIDPATGSTFPGNVIPQNRMDPAALAIFQRLPLPNTPDGRYVAQIPQPTNGNQYLVKVDQQIGSKNSLSVKFWHDVGNIRDALPSASTLPWSPGQFQLTVYNASINDTHIISPNIVNQLIIGFNRRDEERYNLVKQSAIDLGIAITPPVQPFLPTITDTGRFNLGVEINGQPTKLDNVISTNDTLSWIFGGHTLRLGASREGARFEGRPFFDNGTFTFSGQITGNSLADLLIGRPVTFSDLKGRIDDDNMAYYGFFAQDDYRVNSRLTLDLGVRYEYDTRMYQRQKHEANFVPGIKSQVYPQAPVGLVYPGDHGWDRSLYFPDHNNFAPRIGVAWDLLGNGKTALRAGYGVFYQILDVEFANYLGQNPPFATSVVLNNPYSLSDPWHGLYIGGVNDPISTYNPNPATAVFAPPLTLYGVDPHIRNGYVQQYSFSIQHQLPWDTLLQVAYAGNAGRKLTIALQGNPAIPGSGATVGNTNTRRVYLPGTYAGVTRFEGANNTNYNSLQISATKRFSHDFALSLAYTWSKSIDFYDAEAVAASVNNPYNLNTDRGPASFDLRHLFSGSIVWQPGAFLHSPNWALRNVAGGWEFSLLLAAHSGMPFNVVTGRDNSLTGVGSDRPDLIANPVLAQSRSTQQKLVKWFNPAAFVANGPGDFGTIGRNVLIGPSFFNADFSMMRNLRIYEKHQLQFRSEFFNVLNHANFANPDSTFYDANFGRILAITGNPRLIQLALRYSF